MAAAQLAVAVGDDATEVLAALADAMPGLDDGTDIVALMTSAGWDSRTLLAASAGNPTLHCYSHGDPASRELRLARELAMTPNALRLKVHRLTIALRKCVFECLRHRGDRPSDAPRAVYH